MVQTHEQSRVEDGLERKESPLDIAGVRVPVWAPAYLAALAVTGKYLESAEKAGKAFKTVWEFRQRCPAFVEAEKEAMAVASAALEDEVRRRSLEGLRRYKFTKGGDPIIDPRTGEPYFELEYSDPLLLRYLEKNETGSWVPRQKLDHHAGGAVPTTAAARRAAMLEAEKAMAEARLIETSDGPILETVAINDANPKTEILPPTDSDSTPHHTT